MIIARGGRFAGRGLCMKGGKAKFVHNWLGRERHALTTSAPLPPGKASIRYEFASDGGKRGAGGKGALFANGKRVAGGRIAKAVANLSSPDEAADVGVDDAAPVTDDYKEGDSKFTGKIHKVTIELKK